MGAASASFFLVWLYTQYIKFSTSLSSVVRFERFCSNQSEPSGSFSAASILEIKSTFEATCQARRNEQHPKSVFFATFTRISSESTCALVRASARTGVQRC